VDIDPAPDPQARAIAYAAEVVRQHTPDPDGWCTGCLNLWGRLTPYPCTQVEWAAAVHAADVDGRGGAGPGSPTDRPTSGGVRAVLDSA
jgi:hypothetical protein